VVVAMNTGQAAVDGEIKQQKEEDREVSPQLCRGRANNIAINIVTGDSNKMNMTGMDKTYH